MSALRILIVSDVSSRMRGGVPSETRGLIQGLARLGHAVALASDVPLEGAEQAEHFPITLPVQNALATEIGLAIARFEPDFVHVLCMSSRGLMQLAPTLHSHRWALTVHSVPPYERKLSRWHGHEALHYGARALRFLPNSMAWRWVFHRGIVPRVVVHSKYVEGIVVRYGCARDRVVLIPLPCEPAASAPPGGQGLRNEAAPLLVTVAGYAHTKGQHDVVKALPILLARFPGLRYQIIGEVRDRSYVHHLKRLAHTLKVSDHLLITPDLNHADKQAALERADVYVQPSHEEGFCLAYAEAATLVPRLVGCDSGAIAAMSQDDVGARVVASRAPQAVAAAVAALLQTELPVDHMAKRALRLEARFSSLGFLQAHEKMYAEIFRETSFHEDTRTTRP